MAAVTDMTAPITEGVDLLRRFDGFPATVALHSVIGGRKSQVGEFESIRKTSCGVGGWDFGGR